MGDGLTGPSSGWRDSNTMFDGTEYDNKVPWQVPAIQYAVCNANPMVIVFASKKCVGECCAIPSIPVVPGRWGLVPRPPVMKNMHESVVSL
jgi:hypothetical protein